MMRVFKYATIFLVVLSVFLVPGANAGDLSADYVTPAVIGPKALSLQSPDTSSR